MADTGVYATTLQVQEKAGAHASSVSNVEAYINSFVAQAESEINVATLFNWSDVYSTLNADVKMILTEAASNLAAMYVINYDTGGFSSLSRAELALDVLRDGYTRALSLLRDIKQKDFTNGA